MPCAILAFASVCCACAFACPSVFCVCLRLLRARGCVFVAVRAGVPSLIFPSFARLFSLHGALALALARVSLAFHYLNAPCNSLGQERASSFASLESHMASSFGTFDLNAPVLEDEDGNGGFDLNEFPLETETVMSHSIMASSDLISFMCHMVSLFLTSSMLPF